MTGDTQKQITKNEKDIAVLSTNMATLSESFKKLEAKFDKMDAKIDDIHDAYLSIQGTLAALAGMTQQINSVREVAETAERRSSENEKYIDEKRREEQLSRQETKSLIKQHGFQILQMLAIALVAAYTHHATKPDITIDQSDLVSLLEQTHENKNSGEKWEER